MFTEKELIVPFENIPIDRNFAFHNGSNFFTKSSIHEAVKETISDNTLCILLPNRENIVATTFDKLQIGEVFQLILGMYCMWYVKINETQYSRVQTQKFDNYIDNIIEIKSSTEKVFHVFDCTPKHHMSLNVGDYFKIINHPHADVYQKINNTIMCLNSICCSDRAEKHVYGMDIVYPVHDYTYPAPSTQNMEKQTTNTLVRKISDLKIGDKFVYNKETYQKKHNGEYIALTGEDKHKIYTFLYSHTLCDFVIPENPKFERVPYNTLNPGDVFKLNTESYSAWYKKLPKKEAEIYGIGGSVKIENCHDKQNKFSIRSNQYVYCLLPTPLELNEFKINVVTTVSNQLVIHATTREEAELCALKITKSNNKITSADFIGYHIEN